MSEERAVNLAQEPWQSGYHKGKAAAFTYVKSLVDEISKPIEEV